MLCKHLCFLELMCVLYCQLNKKGEPFMQSIKGSPLNIINMMC